MYTSKRKTKKRLQWTLEGVSADGWISQTVWD